MVVLSKRLAHHQVVGIIVSLVTIKVMDNLPAPQPPSDFQRSYVAMQIDNSTRIRQRMITVVEIPVPVDGSLDHPNLFFVLHSRTLLLYQVKHSWFELSMGRPRVELGKSPD